MLLEGGGVEGKGWVGEGMGSIGRRRGVGGDRGRSGIQVVDQTCYLTHSQYTDTRPTIPSTDPVTPGRVATEVSICKPQV